MSRTNFGGSAVLATLMLFFAMAAVSAQETPLFEDTDPGIATSAGLSDDPGILRTRFVNVNLGAIAQGDVQGAADVTPTLSLNLFDGDIPVKAVLEHIDSNRGGGYSWVGRVEGNDFSSVILSIRDGILVGNINTPTETFQIRYEDTGIQTIREVDYSQYPPDAEPIPVDTGGLSFDIPPATTTDTGSTIDVMVVYTPAVRIAEGGTAATQVLIDSAVSETNVTYTNSGVVQRLRLVHTEEVVYTASGSFSTDLQLLTGTDDGDMDNVHALRDTYGADEVVLLVDDTQYCGVAWVMSTVTPGFESHAFAVVARLCTSGNYVVAHELGHNMSARHDWYEDDTSGAPFTYNHGHINFAEGWRTVMSYNNAACSNGFCSRIPYWSNPNLTYGGDPLGVPEGETYQAENYRTLNNTAFTVANFRQAIIPCPPIGIRVNRRGN